MDQHRRYAMTTTTTSMTALFRFYLLVCRVVEMLVHMVWAVEGEVNKILCVLRCCATSIADKDACADVVWPPDNMPHTYFITPSTDVMEMCCIEVGRNRIIYVLAEARSKSMY